MAAIVRVDRNGTINHWNAAAERLFGFTKLEAIGNSVELIIPPQSHVCHRHGFALKQVSTGPSRHKGPPHMRRPFAREDQPATELQLTVGVSNASSSMISRVAPEASFMRSVLSPKYDPWQTALLSQIARSFS